MEDILYQRVDEKGRVFTICGDIPRIQSRLQPYFDADPDDEDMGINHITKGDPYGDERFTAEERQEDVDGFRIILGYGVSAWIDVFEKIPRKKNGTFAKGRVVLLHRGDTFAHYWEDSYGWNAPELRMKTLDDFTAELELAHVTQGH